MRIEVQPDRIVLYYVQWRSVATFDEKVQAALKAFDLTLTDQIGNNDNSSFSWLFSPEITEEIEEKLQTVLER